VSARKLEIKSQPEETIVEAGEPAVFQVFAEGDGLIYQWQTREPDREDWRDTQGGEGYETSRLTISETSAKGNNTGYRCRITDRSGETVYTDTVKLYVLAIQASPKDQYVKAEDSASFKVSATGKDLHYSWEYCRASGDEWKKSTAAGHDTAVLQVPGIPVGHNGFRYRCAVTDAGGNKIYSEDAYLYVMGFTGNPSNQYVKQGDSAVFKVKASGKGLKYRWIVKLPGEDEWRKSSEEGADTPVLKLYDLPTAKNNRRFRCMITDEQGNKMYSEAAALYVLGITANPTSEYVKEGATVYFIAEATGKGLKYQWQVKLPDEDEWKNTGEHGAKTTVLKITDVSVAKNKRQYRCKVTDEKGNKTYSKAAGVYVLSIKSNPSSQNIKEKGTVDFKVTATGSGLKYQWQTRNSSNHGWYNWTGSGNKSKKISVYASTSDHGHQFRCAVTDKVGNTVYSNAATLYVFGITGNPKDQSVKAGKKVEFHVSATGRDLKYQWQVKTSSGGSWKNTSNSGNKTSKLKFEAKTGYNGYYYRCKVTDKLGRVMYSKSAKLTVKKGSGGGGSGDQYNVITPNF
ncbi:MAG: hypothetical protein Q4D81_02445, partial [Eubacteriales bacterium]|nr:hypothetical protein [Eubacteriales bacterium]